ncbi:WD40 repeat domain-containing protein [Vibrio tubiashii]|uniref:Lipoprotein n=1 Tax=Vibrio tubiashii ATCC 19109 TaxID=1051646 RepID=F9T176_9VIBR|nr:PQQ-binding-like beta-propeller repeat protein [Vibrio tubiashii]AIW15218.1 lipoprotein [Vibrio tubiashii ATCC 19109]EGU58364.1 Vegetatible incompatibility protein HET-E-1 [Vibrio tubiashii ATCC 19109]EIF05915.1 WD40 repeat protein [Vibrio tubiashii NCIMB 1337 = ATCC 19106]
MRIIFNSIIITIVITALNGCFFSAQDSQRWTIEPKGTTSFALSRDARFALLYSKEHQLVLWDLDESQELASLGAQDPQSSTVSRIRISDNGRFAVTATQINFAVWDLAWTQAEGLWSISDGLIRDVDIASNGDQVLLGLSNGKAIYVNLVTGRRLEFLAHNEKVNSVALSPNGRFALSGGNDYKAHLWDTNTGQILKTFEHEQRVNRVALQRDGKYAFTSDGGNQAIIWDLTTGEEMSKLRSFSRQLIFSTARFSDDGQYLVTGTPSSRIMVWDTHTGKRVDGFEAEPLKDTRPPRAVVYDAAFDSQNRVISGTSAGIAQAWDVDY